MKHLISALFILTFTLLAACGTPPNTSAHKIDNNVATHSPATSTTTPTSAQSNASTVDEETGIRNLVEDFGKKLQEVSLLAPNAAQEIQNQYSEFVTPGLLEMWMKDVSKAPGRMVSSPWPDHIEIATLSKEDTNRYEITGYVIEVTSTEVIDGGEAARIPVRIVVQKDQGRWFITEFAEER